MTFSPFTKVCSPTVKILSTGAEVGNFFKELDEASAIKMSAVLPVPIITDNLSFS